MAGNADFYAEMRRLASSLKVRDHMQPISFHLRKYIRLAMVTCEPKTWGYHRSVIDA